MAAGFKAAGLWAGLIALLWLCGCADHERKGPELRVLYEPAAQTEGPDRNPIIVIPGILGSRLVEAGTGRIVWGAFDSGYADPKDPADAHLIALPLDSEEQDGVVKADGVLDRLSVRLAGVAFDIQAYVGILSTLGVGGYRDQALGLNAIDYGNNHFTCFQFPYDWRRDNVENAKRLKAFIDEKRAYVQAEYKKRFGMDHAPVKFDLVAHSMGGLLARYFLMYGTADLPADGSLPELTWAGARDIERAILVATPNAGAVDALRQLVGGKSIGPFLPYYPPALLGTFPSVYQLLPRPEHGHVVWDNATGEPVRDLLDPALWQRLGWGLAAPDQEAVLATLMPTITDPTLRRRLALEAQARALTQARRFMAALDRPAVPPDGLSLGLVAGDAKPTPNRLSVSRRDGTIEVTDSAPGDGTVLRSSALGDQRLAGAWQPRLASPVAWSSTLFLFSDHIGLTRDPVFTDNVLYWLLEEPRDRRARSGAGEADQTSGFQTKARHGLTLVP